MYKVLAILLVVAVVSAQAGFIGIGGISHTQRVQSHIPIGVYGIGLHHGLHHGIGLHHGLHHGIGHHGLHHGIGLHHGLHHGIGHGLHHGLHHGGIIG